MIRRLMCTVGVLFCLAETVHAGYRVPQGWVSQKICQLKDSRQPEKSYCLEILELMTGRIRKDKAPAKGSIVLIPGLFQNVYIFDPLPRKGVSFARYLAKEFNYRIFVLHVRGIGQSDYPKNSNLDDIAIDDIPQAIEALKEKTGGPIFVLGHSQGAITLQASLAGLSRKSLSTDKNEFFDKHLAQSRQKLLGGVGPGSRHSRDARMTGKVLVERF